MMWALQVREALPTARCARRRLEHAVFFAMVISSGGSRGIYARQHSGCDLVV